MKTLSVWAAALFLFACASAPQGNATDYYAGTTTVLLPDGRSVPGGAVLVRRTLDRRAGTITEDVVTEAQRGRDPAEYIALLRVEGSKFTVTESNHAFTGEGELRGKPWRWREWTSRVTLPGGMRVESIDRLDGNRLTVEKKVLAPDGSLVVSTVERYEGIDAERFARERTHLLHPE